MKKIICGICLLLSVCMAMAQSQAEIDKMKKQMEEAMKDMPPEAKKMMDSMGIKMPDPDKIVLPKGMTMDKIQQKQKEMIVAAKSYRKKSLAEMPKKVLTDAELAIYIQNSFKNIDAKISSKAKENAQKIIATSKTKDVSIEGSAIFAFLNKGSQEALWIFAKLAAEDPKNSNLLCNYVAIASMCGIPHISIPVLNNLNNKYPGNSTVLNNLGQAWYDFEKKDSAEKYLKLAIKVSPNHVNANHTESRICAGNGDIAGQIAYLKNALKGAYSDEIASELKKAGVKPAKKDVSWSFPYDSDPLGFRNIEMPDYPVNTVSSDELKPKWAAFKSKCKQEAEKYMSLAKELTEAIAKNERTFFTNALQTKKLVDFSLPYAELAATYYREDLENGLALNKKWVADFTDYQDEKIRLDKIKTESDKLLDEEMERTYKGKCPGEGCPYQTYCLDYSQKANKISNAYLIGVNTKYEKALKEELEMLRLTQGAAVNIAVYASPSDEKLEWQKAMSKAAYLTVLADVNYEFLHNIPEDCGSPPEKPGGKIKLQDFEDVTCPEKDKFNLTFGIGKIAFNCTKISMEGGELIQGSFEKDLKTGDYEFGIGLGVSWHAGSGPFTVEAGGKLMGIYQFDESGNYTGGGLKLNIGMQANAGNLSAEAERSLTYFINTGCESPGLSIGDIETSSGIKQ